MLSTIRTTSPTHLKFVIPCDRPFQLCLKLVQHLSQYCVWVAFKQVGLQHTAFSSPLSNLWSFSWSLSCSHSGFMMVTHWFHDQYHTDWNPTSSMSFQRVSWKEADPSLFHCSSQWSFSNPGPCLSLWLWRAYTQSKTAFFPRNFLLPFVPHSFGNDLQQHSTAVAEK